MYIGIDLGGTNIAAGLINKDGKIIRKDSVKAGAERHYSEIIKDMAELSKKVTLDAGYSLEDIEWVGIGSPGSCDSENGILIYANNLGFFNTPMRAEFQKHFNVPVYLANDADCAAYGEAMAGNAKDVAHSITVTLGTGVGGGIIIDNKIVTGFNCCGGELGHMVISIGGEICSCGKHGCWEAYASATALIRQTCKAMEENPDSLMWKEAASLEEVSGRTAFDAAKKGDRAAQQVVDTYLHYVSVGISNIVTIFQPEKVLIGGGISNEGEYILKPIRDYVRSHDYCKTDKKAEISTAALANDAGIIGAAFLGAQYAGK
ncbi:MAG: ROK family protein [Ruminococcaceae bacterium]|nr:ROK family protein [Oscillospiraceae bacterium]